MRKISSFFLLLLSLGACEHPGPPAPTELTFTRYQPIYFDVGSIDIVEDYEPPMHPPNVDHLIPISPSDAMHSWIKDRLRAVGGTKSLEVTIKDASVISTPLPATGLINLNHVNRYDARLEVDMRIYGSSDALSLANINVIATRSITIPEKASLAERSAMFRQMMFDLMESMNAELEKNIYQYFGSYISYSHGV